MPRSKPRCDLGEDWAFGLFIASTVSGALVLLAFTAAISAWVESGGDEFVSQADYYKSVGFWLSMVGNMIALVLSTVLVCVLGWRNRQPQKNRRPTGKNQKILPNAKKSPSTASSGVSPPVAEPGSEALISREAQSKAYMESSLQIIVVGASGDLAKKKTYPSLLELMEGGYLPENTEIWGFARSNLGREGLHERLEPFLQKSSTPEAVARFLSICSYHQGTSYNDVPSWEALSKSLKSKNANRVFYFAIPPSAFGPAGKC